jgi:hypothetical protein
MKMSNDDARVILALAAESDDTFVWDRLKIIQAEMFLAGPVQIKFAYFAREGALQTRPYITTSWVTNADDMANIMDRGRAGCVCGCYIQIGDILDHALRETQQGSVQAVVIVGDHFHGSLDHAVALAKQLHAAGTRLFLFQQGCSGHAEHVFRTLAEQTGGAYFQFNRHIERVAERLPGMLEAVTHFAIGGTAALEAQTQDNESAVLLLEQMTKDASNLQSATTDTAEQNHAMGRLA